MKKYILFLIITTLFVSMAYGAAARVRTLDDDLEQAGRELNLPGIRFLSPRASFNGCRRALIAATTRWQWRSKVGKFFTPIDHEVLGVLATQSYLLSSTSEEKREAQAEDLHAVVSLGDSAAFRTLLRTGIDPNATFHQHRKINGAWEGLALNLTFSGGRPKERQEIVDTLARLKVPIVRLSTRNTLTDHGFLDDSQD